MSRLTNYLKSKELAKLQLTQAEILLSHGKTDRAVTQLIGAVKELLIAQSNLVSLAFQKRNPGKP